MHFLFSIVKHLWRPFDRENFPISWDFPQFHYKMKLTLWPIAMYMYMLYNKLTCKKHTLCVLLFEDSLIQINNYAARSIFGNDSVPHQSLKSSSKCLHKHILRVLNRIWWTSIKPCWVDGENDGSYTVELTCFLSSLMYYFIYEI